jgi:lysophospholipase L1-like esterase
MTHRHQVVRRTPWSLLLSTAVLAGCAALSSNPPAMAQQAQAATEDAAAMPEWLAKVQLHNFAGVELTDDGQGVWLYRLPREVRDKLDTRTPDGQERSGAQKMRFARQSEIRFVLDEGAKLSDVKLHLQATKDAQVAFFWGDVLTGTSRLGLGGKARPVTPMSHGLLDSLIEKFPRGRFANRVCRVVIDGGEISLHGVEGKVRPPKAEELAPVMLSYGTSISEGAAASRGDLAWNALTARALGYDLINLGSSGTAFCEPIIADYLSSLDWDLCVLEISVNMAGTGFTTEQFKERAALMIDKLATSHPEARIVCISLFPFGTGDLWKNPNTKAYREALEEIVNASGCENVHFISGPDLLSFTGLSRDLLHPSDHGMIEISTKLSARIREIMERTDRSAITGWKTTESGLASH